MTHVHSRDASILSSSLSSIAHKQTKDMPAKIRQHLCSVQGYVRAWLCLESLFGKAPVQSSLTKQPRGAGSGDAEGPDPSHSGQTCTFLPGSHAAARLMKRLFSLQGPGLGVGGSRQQKVGMV